MEHKLSGSWKERLFFKLCIQESLSSHEFSCNYRDSPVFHLTLRAINVRQTLLCSITIRFWSKIATKKKMEIYRTLDNLCLGRTGIKDLRDILIFKNIAALYKYFLVNSLFLVNSSIRTLWPLVFCGKFSDSGNVIRMLYKAFYCQKYDKVAHIATTKSIVIRTTDQGVAVLSSIIRTHKGWLNVFLNAYWKSSWKQRSSWSLVQALQGSSENIVASIVILNWT